MAGDEDLPWDGGTTTSPPPSGPTTWSPDMAQKWDQVKGFIGDYTGPPVPHGHTKVDTASLDLFRRNIEALIQPVKDVLTELRESPSVQPGAFYHADLIRSKINGPNGDAGLRAQFILVLNDLLNALLDLAAAVKKLSDNYKSTEKLNGAKADDVSKIFNKVTTDFNALISDAGGTASSGTH
jgi:hypothetical protein